MEERNASRIADEILGKWLARYGQGRTLFPAIPDDESNSSAGDDTKDRPSQGSGISDVEHAA
jgi:hypothetical protein